MPATDAIHEPVKNALIKDGWTITDDPYTIIYEELALFADLGAERPIGAERGGRKLIVEAKSFRDPSPMNDFKTALGQFLIYKFFLETVAPQHELFLAVGHETYEDVFEMRAFQRVLQRYQVAVVVVDTEREEIIRWIR